MGNESDEPPSQIEPSRSRRAAVLAAVALGYLAIVAVATYPVLFTAGTALPGHLSDPLEHLWIMRWSARCLTEGRSPFFCPDAQYPVGVPLGLFPTMHLQTAGYLALGLLTSSDVLRFNVLWAFGFVSTGVASFVLAWSVVRRFWPAWLGGLGVMLCGPMLMHAHGHLETMQMGALPLFLLGWLRFVDRPGRQSLAVATGLYLLVVASAPYFAVLAVFPAAWYVAWAAWREAGTSRRWAWVKARAGWLTGFVVATLPGLALLFAPQIWAVLHGHVLARPRSQFNWFGAPAWSYVTPTSRHALGAILATDLYATRGYGGRMFECESYLGLLALGMLGYAIAGRVRFPRAGYWWTTLAMLVVLSWGAYGPRGIRLPAGWLYDVFPPFHLIRVPARFNLFAAAVAVVPVAAALRDLLDRVGTRWGKGVLIAFGAIVTTIDLAVVPFPTSPIPPMPPIYAEMVRADSPTSFLDAPMFGSSQGHVLGSLCGYWQSVHRGRTSAGYSGVANQPFDAEVVEASPWSSASILGVAAKADLNEAGFGPIRDVAARDYAWLFLSTHGYDHLVLHQGAMLPADHRPGVERWKTELAVARVAEDGDVAVFDRAKLARPTTPVATIGQGWRPLVRKNPRQTVPYAALRTAKLVVFNPDPGRAVRLELDGVEAPTGTRQVRLLDPVHREITAWTVGPGQPTRITATFPLPEGLQTLTIASDAEARPARREAGFDEAKSPYSFLLRSIRFGFEERR